MLENLTVLDFTRVLAGPYCTRLMADLGAQIIKVERPITGDDARVFYLQLEQGRLDQSSYFVRLNAGKQSIAIDLGHPNAQAVIMDLVKKCDVLIENFVPGVMSRHGLDYTAVSAVNPKIIYCSISGYGQTGPLRDQPAFAHLINAASGVLDIERQGDAEPRMAIMQYADALAGTHAFGLIVAAVHRRSSTGQGAYLDVSMMQSLWSAEDINIAAILNGGQVPSTPRPGTVTHAINGEYITFQFICGSPVWHRLRKLMGSDSGAFDTRYDTGDGCRANWTELRELIVGWLGNFSTANQALSALMSARIPCAPVCSMNEALAHEHLEIREAFSSIPHPSRGHVRVTASPYHIDGSSVPAKGAAPYRPGEHTLAILAATLGYSPAQIKSLVASGAVAVPC